MKELIELLGPGDGVRVVRRRTTREQLLMELDLWLQRVLRPDVLAIHRNGGSLDLEPTFCEPDTRDMAWFFATQIAYMAVEHAAAGDLPAAVSSIGEVRIGLEECLENTAETNRTAAHRLLSELDTWVQGLFHPDALVEAEQW